ncbi:hypothetical protein [uncultured Fibrella sp.]|uniref:hypothetical protein n=1 Tax=uncultured Fibrella sp. TaxID=1284596 RepID=UPI0035CC7767
MVAIWNIPANRFADYFSEKVITHIPEPTRTTVLTRQIKGKPTATRLAMPSTKPAEPRLIRRRAKRAIRRRTGKPGFSLAKAIRSILGKATERTCPFFAELIG